MIEQTYMSPKELARACGVHLNTIYRAIEKREIPVNRNFQKRLLIPITWIKKNFPEIFLTNEKDGV